MDSSLVSAYSGPLMARGVFLSEVCAPITSIDFAQRLQQGRVTVRELLNFAYNGRFSKTPLGKHWIVENPQVDYVAQARHYARGDHTAICDPSFTRRITFLEEDLAVGPKPPLFEEPAIRNASVSLVFYAKVHRYWSETNPEFEIPRSRIATVNLVAVEYESQPEVWTRFTINKNVLA